MSSPPTSPSSLKPHSGGGFGYRAPVRRYRGVMVDSARWERFTFRRGDVVISTPSKCGTTWMQTIVGMLLLDRVDLGAPISTLSPWLDMLIRTDDEVFGLLETQTHRRFIKTHTPLDGVPRHDEVTYIAVIRLKGSKTNVPILDLGLCIIWQCSSRSAT
jgi:Sulfotransferase domain